MDIQEQLRHVSLEEASRIISNSIISARSKLDDDIRQLEKDRKKYEEDYIIANDGDSSENAPLDEAKKNLRDNMGAIVAKLALAEQMDNIELKEYRLGTYDFSTIEKCYESLNIQEKQVANEKLHCNSEKVLLERMKTISDDQLYDEVVNYHFTIEKTGSEEELAFDEAILLYLLERKLPMYNYSGKVTLYSTVRLKYNDTVLTYKIYPDKISFLDIGVLAANSRVAVAIMGRQKGDIVTLEHTTKQNVLEYEILDIY